MTRQRLAPIRDQPDQRGGAIHPLAQAVRLLTEWLSRGPLTGRQIDRLAAQRGLSPSWVGQALWTLVNRREVTETGSGRDTTYTLTPSHQRQEPPPPQKDTPAPPTTGAKTCTKCDQSKPLAEFHRRASRCKPCVSEYRRAYYQANKPPRKEPTC